MSNLHSRISNFEKELKKLQNLNDTYFKLISELKNYITIFFTLTFGNTDFMRVKGNMGYERKISQLTHQCKSINFFLKKLRKTKKIKNDLYYFAAKELQKDGNLHLHMSLNIHEDDLLNFIEFIYWFKKQKFNNIGQIGRTHFSVSTAFKNKIETHFILKEIRDKKDNNKILYWFPLLETREFSSGEANFIEFVSLNDLKERYQKNILEYITKTVISHNQISKDDLKVVKMGIIKNYNEHHIKSLVRSVHTSDFKKDIELIRSICKKIYTTTRFPISYHVYQRNYMKLIKCSKNFKKFFNVIKACETGVLELKNNTFYYYGKEVI